jgi:type IV pilus assembly protein PilC
MPKYSYCALNERNRKIRGEMICENEVVLEARLREIELDLIDSRELKQRRALAVGGVRLNDMLIFCVHMEQLIKAGVPVHEALADVRDATDSARLRDILADVLERVKGGSSFSEALGKYPRVFTDVFVGLVRAGEKNGNLTQSFHHMGEHLKWTSELRRKVKRAVSYPSFVLLVMVGVISIMMLYVVPQMVRFIIDQGFEVPLHTRALIATSEFFQHYWFLVLGLPVAFIFFITISYRLSPSLAYTYDGIILRLPMIGKVSRKINIARFVQFFSIMFQSGIDIPDALLSAKNVVSNRVIQESIDMTYKSVNEGNNLTDSLRASSQFPQLVIRMFKIGEDSGNMTESLQNISFFYTREVDDAVDGMVGMVQPALTLVMGALIFWVIAAVFGPIYNSFQNMKI